MYSALENGLVSACAEGGFVGKGGDNSGGGRARLQVCGVLMVELVLIRLQSLIMRIRDDLRLSSVQATSRG